MFVIGILAASGIGVSAWAYQGNPGQNGPSYSPARHEQMEQAFENNDYAAWKELMGGRGRVTEVITEANFAKLAEMHQLFEEGKYAEANQIRQELGLGIGSRAGRGRMYSQNSGQKSGGNFVDENKDGICDHRQ